MELAWAVMGLWLLGIMSVSAIVERGGDPLSLVGSLGPQKRACGVAWAEQGAARLPELLATAVKDNYQRLGSKKRVGLAA